MRRTDRRDRFVAGPLGLLSVCVGVTPAWSAPNVPEASQGASPGSDAYGMEAGSVSVTGDGCPKPEDVHVVQTDAELALSYSRMALHLDGFQTNELASTAQCIVRIPLWVPLGFYPAEIRQTMQYTLAKTAGAQVSIRMATELFAVPWTPLEARHERGASATEGVLQPSTVVPIAVGSDVQQAFCDPRRSPWAILSTTVGIATLRASLNDSVRVVLSGAQAKTPAWTSWLPCP